jgi:hypothetical protein
MSIDLLLRGPDLTLVAGFIDLVLYQLNAAHIT